MPCQQVFGEREIDNGVALGLVGLGTGRISKLDVNEVSNATVEDELLHHEVGEQHDFATLKGPLCLGKQEQKLHLECQTPRDRRCERDQMQRMWKEISERTGEETSENWGQSGVCERPIKRKREELLLSLSE